MKSLKITLMAMALVLMPSLAQTMPCESIPQATVEGHVQFACDSATGEWVTAIGSVFNSGRTMYAQAPKLLDTAKEHLEKVAEKNAAEDGEVPLTGLLQDGAKIYSDWKALGWMGGLMALVSLLMNLLRFGPLHEFFRVNKLMWLKPLLAALFGGVAAGLSTAMTGAGVMPSMMAGLLAGLGAIGLYETTKRRKSENRVK